jgi:histidinol-phosphate aminotransferase
MISTPVAVRGSRLRLHLNENTAGCSPAVLEALRSLRREDVATYPDYGPITSLTENWFGVPPGWVQLTNGLDEGLQVVAQHARLLGGASFEVLIVEPSFEMYAACAQAAGGRVVSVALQEDFEFPIDAVLGAISPRTRLVYLTDPNNPTGRPIPAGSVEQIAAAAPHAVVLLDEAYADFSGRTTIGPALDRHRNLIVGRTFAKGYGLAGLRAGALVAHPATLEPLRRILPPYSVNVCAVQALGAALEDRAYVDWYVTQSAISREMIYACCERLGLRYWTSEANFVLVRIGEAASTVVDQLGSRGILVRDRSTDSGCAGCVRIAAGLPDHTAACLAALEDVLAALDR